MGDIELLMRKKTKLGIVVFFLKEPKRKREGEEKEM